MLADVKDLVRLLRRIAITVVGTVILAIGIAPPLLLDRLRKPEWKATSGGPAPQS